MPRFKQSLKPSLLLQSPGERRRDSADEAQEFAAAVVRFSAPTGRRWEAEVTTRDGRPVVLVEQRPLRLAGPPVIDLARVAFDAP